MEQLCWCQNKSSVFLEAPLCPNKLCNKVGIHEHEHCWNPIFSCKWCTWNIAYEIVFLLKIEQNNRAQFKTISYLSISVSCGSFQLQKFYVKTKDRSNCLKLTKTAMSTQLFAPLANKTCDICGFMASINSRLSSAQIRSITAGQITICHQFANVKKLRFT